MAPDPLMASELGFLKGGISTFAWRDTRASKQKLESGVNELDLDVDSAHERRLAELESEAEEYVAHLLQQVNFYCTSSTQN